MNLSCAEEGKEYTVKRIDTDDEELDSFLFSWAAMQASPSR